MSIKQFMEDLITIGNIQVLDQDDNVLLESEGWFSSQQAIINKYGSKIIQRMEVGHFKVKLYIGIY